MVRLEYAVRALKQLSEHNFFQRHSSKDMTRISMIMEMVPSTDTIEYDARNLDKLPSMIKHKANYIWRVFWRQCQDNPQLTFHHLNKVSVYKQLLIAVVSLNARRTYLRKPMIRFRPQTIIHYFDPDGSVAPVPSDDNCNTIVNHEGDTNDD